MINAAIEAILELFNQGRYCEAEVLLLELTRRFPLHGFGWKGLGAVFKFQGRSSEALHALQKAADLMPSDAGVHNNLGNSLRDHGRPTEAEASYRRTLELKPDYAEAHNNLGNALKDQGRLTEAEASYRRALALKPDFATAHKNLGVTLMDQSRVTEAEASYRRSLELKPDYAEAHISLGNALKDQGRLTEAEASYRRALALKPDHAEAHNNLGNALGDQGRLTEAEASYRRALELKPDHAEAHNNLGVTLKNHGRLTEAEACYRRALELKPDFAMAHTNLGHALQHQGRLTEAEAHYRRALEIKPDFVEALNNLAYLLILQSKPITALSIIFRSLQIEESSEAKNLFVQCVKHMQFRQVSDQIRDAMVRALSEPWCRPDDIARVVTDMVKLAPNLGDCIARADRVWPQRLDAQKLFGHAGIEAVGADVLLCSLLTSVPVCSIELERFLSMSRQALLDAASEEMSSAAGDEKVLGFYSALARQCFINEYVFAHTDGEIRKASVLRDSLAAALGAKAQVPILWPLAVAAYFPLYSLPLAARLLDSQWPESVTAVLVQQVREPQEERQERAYISRLTSIDDEVSLRVQNQYEENPYPRWIKVAPAGKVMTVDARLRQLFPLVPFQPLGKCAELEMLIAGCGTGQHSIGTAQQIQGARVLAVDLSITSLSYARRKTRELGLTSIEYAQADLLKLGTLGRSFDVIECAGVLHHLADPLAGWQVLLSLLRPRGLMKLGFYSEVARRNIVRVRDFIAARGHASTVEGIRRCRQDLMDSVQNADFGSVLKIGDFFSVSGCRDLLFHVQEHRMTLTGIEAFLRDNHLAFLGFEIDAEALFAYKRRFPDDRAATNLGQWQTFENENPDTFLRMYQFWIQKAG